MAQEFEPSQVAPVFRGNGTLSPGDADYVALRNGGFAGYRLTVGGLVAKPAEFGLDELRAMPARTQITRHDCVEGWSCIGKWTGAKLGPLLDRAGVKPEARYVVFYCADAMDATGAKYYESIDLDSAYHPQTILAYEMNDQILPVPHGAPLRLRVERQLGYKMAKYIMRIELTRGFADIADGGGGYWEDQGYEWYAGI
jgi:DMSO/TMAO reductase YedYZ molybdopterin-dependent catalytic subunit